MGDFINFLGNNLADFWTYTGFANATTGHIVMILVGLGSAKVLTDSSSHSQTRV